MKTIKNNKNNKYVRKVASLRLANNPEHSVLNTYKNNTYKHNSLKHNSLKHNSIKTKQLYGGDINCDNKISSGLTGTIIICDRDGTKYAGKFVNNELAIRMLINDLENEKKIFQYIYDDTHRDTVSENILKFYDIKDEIINFSPEIDSKKINPKHYLFTELCKSDLFDLRFTFPPDTKLKLITFKTEGNENILGTRTTTNLTKILVPESIFILYLAKQLFSGLYYLFQRDIVHYDIKPENTFVSINQNGEYIFKIGDFGSSKIASNIDDTNKDEIDIICDKGTISYMPAKRHKTSKTDFFRDLYAFICLLYSIQNKAYYNKYEVPTEISNGKLINNIITYDDGTIQSKLEKNKDDEETSTRKKHYERMNSIFGPLLTIVSHLENQINKEIKGFRTALFIPRKHPEIRPLYDTAYDAINAFFENPMPIKQSVSKSISVKKPSAPSLGTVPQSEAQKPE